MENYFESPAENANFQDNSCRIEKLNESYLILKQKICRSHELIRQYNDKLKECDRMKVDLATANKELKRMTTNYNSSLAKVIKIELQNTGYKKNVEELEMKIAKYESKTVADQRHVQQLVCKMKDMDGKHSDRILKYDLQISSLQGKVKELEEELKLTKKLSGPKVTKPERNMNDMDENESAEKRPKIVSESKATVDVGINTVAAWPVVKAQSSDACVLTDEFYNTSDNPYPLFCQKCDVILQPPPLEKICHIMKECPRIVEEFTSSPPTVPHAPPRVPPITQPPSTSPLRMQSFPQTRIHDNPAHSTPVSLPPPPQSTVTEKVVDQKPLVRKLLKRVNRLETRVTAQNITRDQSSDRHCQSACLSDTMSSVSEFLREVTRMVGQSRDESTRCRKIRESRVRVIRSHILRPKVMAARRRLPVVTDCNGSWQVDSLRKVQNQKGNKVRKRDIHKLFEVSDKMEKAMQRRIPIKPVVSSSRMHSPCESEVSDSVSPSDDEYCDDNENKVNDNIPMYDEDSSNHETENDEEKDKVSVVETHENSTPPLIVDQDDSTSSDDEKILIVDHCDHKIPNGDVLVSDSDTNHAETEDVVNEDVTVSNTSNINPSIEVPTICSESTIQQDRVTNKEGENVASVETPVSIKYEEEELLIDETWGGSSDRLSNNICTSDDENDMSPPAKIIRMSDTPASPVEDINACTKTNDPVAIPTESTIWTRCTDAKSFNSTENHVTSEFEVNSSKTNFLMVPNIDSAAGDACKSPSETKYASLIQNDVAIQKVTIPFRPILVPIRREQRQDKIENSVQLEDCHRSMDICQSPTATTEDVASECLDNGDRSDDVMKHELHDLSKDRVNEQHSDDRVDALSHQDDNSRQRTCKNEDMSESIDRDDVVELTTPTEILQNYIKTKTLSLSGKSTGTKQLEKKKKKKEDNESIQLINMFVKKQFQRLVDSGWQLSLHNNIVEKLSKTCSARIIAKLAIEFLCEITSNNKKLDKTHTPPAPLMTKAQQRMITLMVDLDPIKPGLIKYLQAGIQYKIFRLNSTPEREIVESLGRTYIVLARILKDRETLRIFCCDALYCLGLNAISIIYIVLTCWPEVFPVRRENGEILPKCIAYFILQQQAVGYFPKLLPLKNLITRLYKYSTTQLVKDDLLKELLYRLENGNENGLDTAITLFAKREGPAWTYEHIVREGLLPMIIGQRHPSVYAAFCLLGNLMRSFPVADPDGTVGEIVDQLCDLMNSGEGSDEQQKGVASALLSLSRHKFDAIVQSVLAWQPKTPLKPRTIEQLRVLFKSKDIDFWRSFIKKSMSRPLHE